MDGTTAHMTPGSDPGGAIKELSQELGRALPLRGVGDLPDEALLDALAALPTLHNQLDALLIVLAAEVADRCARDATLAGDRVCKNGTDLVQALHG